MLPDEMIAHRLGLIPLISEGMERIVPNYNKVRVVQAEEEGRREEGGQGDRSWRGGRKPRGAAGELWEE